MSFCKEVVFLDPPTGEHGMTGPLYNQPRRCRRKAGPNGYCWQHPAIRLPPEKENPQTAGGAGGGQGHARSDAWGGNGMKKVSPRD